VIEVLDARDPQGSRCKVTEAAVVEAKKKLVLVINKTDLVPGPVVTAWQKVLGKEHPTVFFNREEQNSGELVTLLKKLANDTTTVGVVGFPNTGKNSLIAAIQGSGDKYFTVVADSGILASSEDEVTQVLRNQVVAEKVKDPVKPIEEILRRSDKEKLLMKYRIAQFSDATQFLTNVAQSKSKLKKGGVADLEAAGRIVIEDWNNGAMEYYLPPSGFDSSVLLK
jgi:ribosome biogenesis GTPase A